MHASHPVWLCAVLGAQYPPVAHFIHSEHCSPPHRGCCCCSLLALQWALLPNSAAIVSSIANSQGWLIQILRSPPAPVRKFFDHSVCVCFLSLALSLPSLTSPHSGKRKRNLCFILRPLSSTGRSYRGRFCLNNVSFLKPRFACNSRFAKAQLRRWAQSLPFHFSVCVCVCVCVCVSYLRLWPRHGGLCDRNSPVNRHG